MKKEFLIITNNPEVLKMPYKIEWIDGDFYDVLIKSRDLIYTKYKLVNHPLPASIRMFYSPIRSIILDKGKDNRSCQIISDSIEKYNKTMGKRKPDYKNQKDYEFIDKTLLTESLNESVKITNEVSI